MENFIVFYTIVLIIITAIFLIITFLKREVVTEYLDYRGYFSKWMSSHGQPDTSPEETRGPIAPYLKPIHKMSKIFIRFGFTPNKMTFFNFLIGFYAIIFFDLGEFWLIFAGLTILFSGLLDSVDGCIAGITNNETNLGAYLDAVVDRMGDIVWMIGPIIYILKNSNFYGFFYTNLFLIIALAALAAMQIQEYCRARQQGLGLHRTVVTPGERSWRLIIIAVFVTWLGSSYLAQYNLAFKQGILMSIHTAVAIWLIPILFIVLFVLSVISIIQLSIFALKNLDKVE